MRFSLTTDQVAFRDALRDVLGKTPPDQVWERLAELGLFGLLVPEAAGGLGMSEIDAVPLLEQVGYAAVAEPVAETVVAAALDPCLADGSLKVALAADIIHFGRDAGRLLAVAPDEVRLVPPAEVTGVQTVDTTLRAARVRLSPGGAVDADPELTRQRLVLATSAQLVGLGRRMLDLTTAYVTTRHQFGVPVGSFQAMKHHCANALVELEFAAPTVLAAGWAVATRQAESARTVSLAVVLATEAATRTARLAIQCHGAIGYTTEYDLHRFAKRTWALAATVDIDEHLDRIAQGLEL